MAGFALPTSGAMAAACPAAMPMYVMLKKTCEPALEQYQTI
jgi:hypothetical protein